jgi:hypothetical protein
MNTSDRPSLQGRRYVCLVRCSTNAQEDTSIPDQLAVLHDYAKKEGMVHAGGDEALQLGGVSGSHPGARTDIEIILERKRTHGDFDVVLVQDLSRLTRGGVEHGGKIEYDLAAEGIKVVFAGSQLPDGDHAGIVKSVEYYAAQQHAKSISYGAARGQMSAILEGRQVHCLRPPYAVDRLYVSMDGKPLHIVRNRSDGTQQKLDPNTLAVLQTYPKPVKGEPPIRCRKQRGEHIVLIPGAPEYVEIVSRMFRRVLVDGWGDWRIAKELNDLGVLSPNGKTWKRNCVKVILRNPIYTGLGTANRRSSARFHERAKNAPRKLAYELTDIAQRKRPANRHRPKSEWLEQQDAELVNFLGDELRDLAVAYQARFLTGAPKQPRVRKDKHVDSAFVLKGILTSKQGGYPMTGRTQGSKEKPFRYYHVSRSSAVPSSDRTMRRTVRAVPIERAVIDAIRETFVHPNVRVQVMEILRRESESAAVDADLLARLRAEQKEIADQIAFVVSELSVIGRDAAKGMIRQLEARLAALNERISRAEAPRAETALDIEGAADAAVVRLADTAKLIDQLSPHALRELIASMVVRLEVDLTTGAVESRRCLC